MKNTQPTMRHDGSTPTLPSSPLADTIRAKLLEDLGQVQTGRIGQQRFYTPRAELLARVVAPETWVMVMDWITSTRRSSIDTKRNYVDDIRLWADFAAELGIERFHLGCLTSEQVRTWRLAEEAKTDSRGRPRAKTTIRRRLSSLSSLHKYAAQKTTLPPNPVTDDDIPKIDRGRSSRSTPVLEKEHIVAMGAQARDDRELLIHELLYVLAGRVTEMCAAQIETALKRSADGKVALDLTRKEDKERLLALPDRTGRRLLDHVGNRTEGPILLDAEGSPLDRHDVARLIARLGRHAGVLPGRTVTPHVDRASRITHMLDDGAPLEEVQAYADHEDPATTIGYRERRNAAKRNAELADQGATLFDGLAEPGTTLPTGA